MINPEQILDHQNNPHELERDYRLDPEAFRQAFPKALAQQPDSTILAVWQERLFYLESARIEPSIRPAKELLIVGFLAILAGIGTRVLLFFALEQTIAPIYPIFSVLFFLSACFVSIRRPHRKISLILASLILGSGIYLSFLPLEETDSIILAYLHLPVFWWVVLGLAFTGNGYRSSEARLSYLKFNGEFAILYASMAISGMILAALSLQLFQLAGLNIEEFYMENIVVFGAAALAIVAAYLVTTNLKLAKAIAPYLAKIFSPLVFATLLVYLVTVIWTGQNPFLDRDFLIAFNGVLLGVLAVTIFTITENRGEEKKSLFDYLNVALIILALVIDSVALASIVFRLSSYGLTPNRIAVLGVNGLIGVHLAWILIASTRFLRGKTDVTALQKAVTRYLPAYGIWAALVSLTFPWIF